MGNTMGNTNGDCGCGGAARHGTDGFDAEAAVRKLARDVQALTDLVHTYVGEAGLANRDDRVARAMGHAAALARIVGGKATKPGEFPDCALVGNARQFFCSGTLIHPRAVLSAGHCAPSSPTRVRLHCETDVSTGTEEEIPVIKVRVHPQYNVAGPWHDLSLLILARPAVTRPDGTRRWSRRRGRRRRRSAR